MRDMFLTVLSDISAKEIMKALFVHLNKSDEIPTPRQLRDIVYPPKEPLSAAVYVNLQKKAQSGGWLLSTERQYCSDFEQQEMAKSRGGSEDLREADKQIEQHVRMIEF